MATDFYERLGVSRGATETDIKKAFRRVARELHPDVNDHDPDAEEKFKAVAEAYEVLSDPERRQIYDRYGEDGLRTGGYEPFAGFGSFADIFDAFFGGGDPFGGGRRGPAGGGDLALDVEVTLEQVSEGTSVEVAFDAVVLCEHCNGNGAEPGTPIETCERCGGQGQLRAVSRTPFGQVARAVACDVCGGDGKIAQTPCEQCDGRGRKVKLVKLSVDVPAGIEDGMRIRVAGRGHAGEAGGKPDDLYVQVRVRPDERFVRDGDDLVTAVDVPAPLAALGGALQAPTLDGPADVEIPSGTQPGDTILVPGKGLPPLRRGHRGDLRVVAHVVIPRRLSREQRAQLKAFADTLTDDNLQTHEGVFAKLKRAFGA